MEKIKKLVTGAHAMAQWVIQPWLDEETVAVYMLKKFKKQLQTF